MTVARLTKLSTAVSVSALLVFGGSALAADITIENLNVSKPDGKSTAIIKKIVATNTNISKDELTKLFMPDTSKEDRLAITSKMKADLLSIPSIEVTRKDQEGKITLSGIAVTKIDAGKFAKASLEGLNGGGETKKGEGNFTIKSGPLVLENGDVSHALNAVKNGDITDGTWRVGKVSWSNFEIVVPEKKGGDIHYHTFKVGSVSGTAKYEGNIPVDSTVAFNDMVFIPGPNSQAGQGMAAFGYKQVNVGLTMTGVYDVKAKNYKLTDFTIKGKDAAVLSIAGVFGNIDPAAFTGDKRQRMMAMMGGDVDDLKIKVVNNGLLDKALVFFARMKGAQPDAIKQQWAGMAGQMLPMVLGGDSSALQSAAAVSEFIKSPKNLEINASGKAGPVHFMSFAGMKNPMQLFSKVKVEVVANR